MTQFKIFLQTIFFVSLSWCGTPDEKTLTDACMLAQGHSTTGYIDATKKREIYQALSIIKQAHPVVKHIHIMPNFAIFLRLKNAANRITQQSLKTLTETFSGNILNATHNEYYFVNFPEDIDIPEIIKRYQKIPHVTDISHVPLFSLGRPTIRLRDKKPNWQFVFQDSMDKQQFTANNYWITYDRQEKKVIEYQEELHKVVEIGEDNKKVLEWLKQPSKKY